MRVWIACALGCLVLFPLLTGAVVRGDSGQDGEVLYLANCARCHGGEGEGFLQLYPPLAGSRYFGADIAALPCIIRDGLKGEITVGGATYNGIMPGNSRLSPEEIEALVRYLAARWGNGATDLPVTDWLQQCKRGKD